MEGLKMIPYLALVICIAGIVLGASAITLGKFYDSTDNVKAKEVINNGSAALGDVGEQLQTVAIIGIMVVIISLIAGVFVYMRYFG